MATHIYHGIISKPLNYAACTSLIDFGSIGNLGLPYGSDECHYNLAMEPSEGGGGGGGGGRGEGEGGGCDKCF